MPTRILFLGTGPLALPTFQELCRSPEFELAGLVTQPDRTGRGHHQHENPLKSLALEQGLTVLQPASIKTPESVADLQATRADLFVVAAYGQMLSKTVLSLPRLGTINLHASLLPHYRGATPIHAAILNGDTEAGVTIMEIVQKLDAGPMLGSVKTEILPKETTSQLEQRLAQLAVPLAKRIIREIELGTATRTPQDETLATHVKKLTKNDGLIPWQKSALEVERHVRGMQAWPGPFSFLHQPGKPPFRLQILDVEVSTLTPPSPSREPGRIVEVSASHFTVQCGTGTVRILSLQPDGKRPMPAADFLRGRKVSLDDSLA